MKDGGFAMSLREGNAYFSGMGLVAYRPDAQNLKSGSVNYYQVNNSPIVGAIPDKLKLENDTLWVGTNKGVCRVKWQAADNFKNWSCGQFALLAKLPKEGIPLFSSSTSKTPTVTLTPTANEDTVEVLWFSPLDYQTCKGRYEVRYPNGFTATLDENGAEVLPGEIQQIRAKIQPRTAALLLVWL